MHKAAYSYQALVTHNYGATLALNAPDSIHVYWTRNCGVKPSLKTRSLMYEFGSGSGLVCVCAFSKVCLPSLSGPSCFRRLSKPQIRSSGWRDQFFLLWCRRITLWKRGSEPVITISALIANSRSGFFGRNSCWFLTVNFRLSQNDLFSRPGTYVGVSSKYSISQPCG